jgi:hypothetical protein
MVILASPLPNTPSPFHIVDPTSGKATIINSCKYPVYVSPVFGGSSSSHFPPQELIPVNSSWSQDFQPLPDGGVSLKVSNTTSLVNVTQFEYTAKAEGVGEVYYDISFLDCLTVKKNTDARDKNSIDASACPGWYAGVQAVCGSGGEFQCKAEEHCFQDAYWTPENDYQPGAPVYKCKKSGGITFELCAMV